jgi:hypothetical protein
LSHRTVELADAAFEEVVIAYLIVEVSQLTVD